MYKFRSMVVDAEANGPSLSSDNDPRITRWGKIMRKWRIDELPQLWNILKGDMSLVGPRPERQFYIDQIEGKSRRKISEKLLFQLEMYCQGSVFMTTQWVLDNKNFTPQELAGLLADAMPKELADVFREVNLI